MWCVVIASVACLMTAYYKCTQCSYHYSVGFETLTVTNWYVTAFFISFCFLVFDWKVHRQWPKHDWLQIEAHMFPAAVHHSRGRCSAGYFSLSRYSWPRSPKIVRQKLSRDVLVYGKVNSLYRIISSLFGDLQFIKCYFVTGVVSISLRVVPSFISVCSRVCDVWFINCWAFNLLFVPVIFGFNWTQSQKSSNNHRHYI